MNEADRKKIYTLLSKFYPNARQLQDRATLTAWGYVLENYPYDDVKAAVLEYAARNKYFPDLSDITGGLAPLSSEPITPRHTPMGETERRHLAQIEAWQREWHEELRAKGLPNFREATQAGLTPGQWLRLLTAKGGFE